MLSSSEQKAKWVSRFDVSVPLENPFLELAATFKAATHPQKELEALISFSKKGVRSNVIW